MGEQGEDADEEGLVLVEAGEGSAGGSGEGLVAGATTEAAFLVGVDLDVALVGDASVRAGGVAAETESIRFTTISKNWIIPNYIGEYPPLPSASAPSYVRSILDDPLLTCCKGDWSLKSQPINVTNKNCQARKWSDLDSIPGGQDWLCND